MKKFLYCISTLVALCCNQPVHTLPPVPLGAEIQALVGLPSVALGTVGSYALATTALTLGLLQCNKLRAWYTKRRCERRLAKLTPEFIDQHMQDEVEKTKNLLPNPILAEINGAFQQDQIGSIISDYLDDIPATTNTAANQGPAPITEDQEVPEHRWLQMSHNFLAGTAGVVIGYLGQTNTTHGRQMTADFVQSIMQLPEDAVTRLQKVPISQSISSFKALNSIVLHQQREKAHTTYRNSLNSISNFISSGWFSGIRYLTLPATLFLSTRALTPVGKFMAHFGTALWALNELPNSILRSRHRTPEQRKDYLKKIARCRGRQLLLDTTMLLSGLAYFIHRAQESDRRVSILGPSANIDPASASGIPFALTWLGLHAVHALLHIL